MHGPDGADDGRPRYETRHEEGPLTFLRILLHPNLPGAEECSLAFHEGRSLTALTWVAQQPRQGAARSRADEEADQLAEVASVYAERCEHVLGPCDQVPGTNGAPGAGFGGRSSEGGSQADDGFLLLQVRVWRTGNT